METTTKSANNTTAFYLQSWIAFGAALIGMIWAICYLPIDPWARGFMAMGTLFLVSSTITLAKVVRDAQEAASVSHRVDQARLDKLLAEHDPFRPAV